MSPHAQSTIPADGRGKVSHAGPLAVPRVLAVLMALLSGLYAGFASVPAVASGFQVRETDAAGLGTSFAGAGSAAQTPATAFDNPAGLVRLPGLQLSFGGIALISRLVFTGTAQSALGTPLSGATRSNGGNVSYVPNFYASYRITPDVAVGLALSAPYGVSTSYASGWVGRYFADKTDLRTLDVNPSFAYRLAPWLTLGAGVSVQQARAVFSNAINTSTIATIASGQPTLLPDGDLNLHGSSTGIGYNLGVLIEPTSGTRVGLSYRSRVNHVLSGDASFEMPDPLASDPRFRSGPIRTKVELPDTARLSLTQSFGPAWQFYVDGTWTDWSRFKTLNVIRSGGAPLSATAENYRNSFSIAAGASLRVTDRFTLRGGTAFDKSPVRDADRTARGPDADRYWLSAGASYDVRLGTTLDAGYAHLFMPGVSLVSQSATGDMLQGRYRSSMDLIGISMRSVY